MVVTNCSYSPVLLLVQLGDLKPSNKDQYLFLGQPTPCMLMSPGSPQLAQRWGWGGRGRRWWGEVVEGGKRRPPPWELLQKHVAAAAPSRSPSCTAPRGLCLDSGRISLQFALWGWKAGTFFASHAACSVLVALPGWNASFLSFLLSCSEISTPIPLQNSVTACFIFLLSALCFDPLIRGLGFYLEDICLRCLV